MESKNLANKSKNKLFYEDQKDIETALLKKIENKNKNNKNEQKKENLVYNKEILTLNENLEYTFNHFNVPFKVISELISLKSNSKSKSIKLYNEKFGEYIYSSLNEYKNKLPLTSYISKLLFTKQEALANIIPTGETITIENINKVQSDFAEYFNLFFFKYLDNYRDIYLTRKIYSSPRGYAHFIYFIF